MSIILSTLLKSIMIYQVYSFNKAGVSVRLQNLNMKLILNENENEISKFYREISGVKSLNKYSGYDERNITTKNDFNFKELHEKYKKLKKLEKSHPVFLHPLENENNIQITNILNGGLLKEFDEFISK
jgi:hypothetical protein